MGFYDLSGGDFGSVGLTLDAPCTHVKLTKNQTFIAPEAQKPEVEKLVQVFKDALGLKQSFSVEVPVAITPHAGLGSGTQLALAVGAGINALFDLGLTLDEIAFIAKRGSRSGIGLAAFAQGGFLVDSGKHAGTLPQIAFRYDFPENWRIILISDNAHTGVHGTEELQAFQTLTPMQNSLKEIVIKHMAPALARADLLAFGAYMTDLQAYNGAYFAPIQGGHFASKQVENTLTFLQSNGVACVGQSSWGPTGFAIVESQTAADLQVSALKTQFFNDKNLSFSITRGYNKGTLLDNNALSID